MDSSNLILCDGGSRGNPGPSGIGFVIYDPAGAILAQKGAYLGNNPHTNNQAEYLSLINALEEAKSLNLTDITIRMDSKLVVN